MVKIERLPVGKPSKIKELRDNRWFRKRYKRGQGEQGLSNKTKHTYNKIWGK